MAFDASLDRELGSVRESFDGTDLKVSVHSYDEGEAKVQISRIYVKKNGGDSFRKLVRMTAEEAAWVATVLAGDEIKSLLG